MRHRFKSLLRLAVFILRGGVAHARYIGVKVGSNCRIYIRSFGSEPFLIEIGDRVTITSGVKLLTHDGATWLIRNATGQRFQRYAPITIGNDVFIGVNSIIMPGVSIGNRVIVAAGSVVTSSIPDDSVVAGVPAREVSSFEKYANRVINNFVCDSEIGHLDDYQSRVRLAVRIHEERN